MKFAIIGYEIDTQKAKTFKEISDELTIVTLMTFRELGVSEVVYNFNDKENYASIGFIRKSKSYLDDGWIKSKDCCLITGLDEEYFYPEAFGGKDNGYFGLIAYNHSWYAMDEKVKDYFMKYQAKEGVKEVKFFITENYLEMKIIGG